jgi:anaphase-promoting complex subunit 1
MADVTSLGVHTPAGLPYLINEGILPADPKKELYQWDTYTFPGDNGPVEEEILASKDCVVWSQNGVVRTVYRFHLEGEHVRRAVLTRFPKENGSLQNGVGSSTKPAGQPTENFGKSSRRSIAPVLATSGPGQHRSSTRNTRNEASRALVVLLKTKAHVYFLAGSHHIVDLPFEIESAHAAPRGLILQKKIKPKDVSDPSSPKNPRAPNNSFFSFQAQPSASFLRSPTFKRSFLGSQPVRPSPLGGNPNTNDWLSGLFSTVSGSSDQAGASDAVRLYSLTSPFSEVGVVTESLQQPKPRITSKAPQGVIVEFDSLDTAEKIAYVSQVDELSHVEAPHGELMLVVTVNQELRLVTIWHGWYIDEQSLASLIKRRAEHKADKARRRSSFLGTSIGPGTATPIARHRDGARESFAPGASLHVPAELNNRRLTRSVTRTKPKKQDDESAMASQMDPDFQPLGPQQTARESRRISSLVSRGELSNADTRSQSGLNASFNAGAGRRHTSFGPHSERRSLGPRRRSRGSTPGSVFSKSIGFDNDDDTMDLDDDRANGGESVDSILRHIRNTYDAAGLDNVFGSLDEGTKNELILRKIHSFSIGPQPFPESPSKGDVAVKIATLCESAPSPERDDSRLAIYVHDQSAQEVSSLLVEIKDRPFWPDMKDSPRASIPVVLGTNRFTSCRDMSKIHDNDTGAILLSGRGVILSPTDTFCCPLPIGSPYRNSNTLNIHSDANQTSRDVGRNRTLRPPGSAPSLVHAGVSSSIDEMGLDGILHRRQIILGPKNPFVANVLTLCRLILPDIASHLVRSTWCQAYADIMQRPDRLSGTKSSAEWVALTATIFTFVNKLLDPKAKASLNVSKLAATNGPPKPVNGHHAHSRQDVTPMKQPAWSWMASQRKGPSPTSSKTVDKRDRLLYIAATLADDIVNGANSDLKECLQGSDNRDSAWRLMLALHILREEQKLNCLCVGHAERLAPIVAQIGCWLGRAAWSFEAGNYYALEGANQDRWAFVKSRASASVSAGLMDEPFGVFEWLEQSTKHTSTAPYPTLVAVAQLNSGLKASRSFAEFAVKMTPRIATLSRILEQTGGMAVPPTAVVETAANNGFTVEILETLPVAVAAPFREAIARCEKEPPTTWPSALLILIGREDLDIGKKTAASRKPLNSQQHTIIAPPKDVQTITNSLETPLHAVKTREADRHAISQLLFSEDRRLVEATSLMHFDSIQIAECYKQPDWSDAFHFEQQRKVMQWVTTRMIALPAGDGMLHFDSQIPLMTEKYHLPGFNSSAIMQPMGHTVTTDRTGLTEEKVNWAYFHAGVSVGLRISRNAKGIDTSWLVFNKPAELTNRHAGLLLALGLNGHLRSLAKWLSFKYLTPKHTMTSVGLLLGISASYMGTMDSLITRMLSVHITAMLPPGAAELNVSSTTQTAGLMGIGLLYCNTEHRRMSELMLHEVELMDVEDVDNGPDVLRDESYRLSAGFALGLINLAKGKDLKGLHGMHLPERLLGVAVGPRPVNAVHVFDKATAGAVVAIALVYMKSGDKAIARKIDIPDTEAQFDHVRPDMLMLRSMAKHVILWDSILAQSCNDGVPGWIHSNMPNCYKAKLRNMSLSGKQRTLLTSTDVPFYNIATGLAWALSLKYAGSANETARDEILLLLDFFHATKSKGDAYYYDAKLARASIRRCIDVLALAASTVMAGTGDLKTFRYLRRLHGRTDAETPYGSHFAAHLAIGVLFLGGGTYTLGTSDMAVASLICAFYPLFPTDVQDNRVHLQAFRHFWIFAAEARCVIVEDIDTHRPISMPIIMTLRDGSVKQTQAPCLLPELDSIATLQTADPAYWRVTLDFESNATHLAAFRKNQRIHVRHCPAGEAHSSVFGAALAARSTLASPVISRHQLWDWIFSLPTLREELTKADIELIIPPDVHSSVHTDERATVIDDRLVLSDSVQSGERGELWNLRLLFDWAEKARDDGNERLRWIGNEVVEALKAGIEARTREAEKDTLGIGAWA